MKYKNLTIIGTSHIAKQSIQEVEKTIDEEKPEIVALELDKGRLAGLLSEKKQKIRLSDIRKIGIKGYIFSLIGAYVEKELGKKVGAKPGDEMIIAYKTAQKHHLKVALIDQDIRITLQRFSKEFKWKEKWNLFVDIIKGVFLKKEVIKFDLTKVPDKKLIELMIYKVKKRYPSLYKVLVEERNNIMARNLYHLMRQFPEEKIIAIVGAGHEKEMIDIIKKLEKVTH